MTIGTILKKAKTGEQIEVININEVTKVAMVRLEDGKTRPYSMNTLKDKRQWISLEQEEVNPDPAPVEEDKEENLTDEDYVAIDKEIAEQAEEEEAEEVKEDKEEKSGRKPRIIITYNGKTQTPGEWATEFGMDPKRIRLALRKGKSPEEIFNGKNK